MIIKMKRKKDQPQGTTGSRTQRARRGEEERIKETWVILPFFFSFFVSFVPFVVKFFSSFSPSSPLRLNSSSDLKAALAIDLQWFAAEDEGRTEEPSEYKIQKAREEGRVAKSQELIGALGLLLPALTLVFFAPWMLRTCVEMIRFFMLRAVELDPTRDRVVAGVFFSYFIKLVLPVLTVAVVSALFSNLVQTGFLFTTKPLTPDFTRILPRFGQYFQRTLFSMEGLFNFFKSIVKMAIIGSVAYILITSDIEKLTNLQKVADIGQSLRTVAGLAAKMLIISALLLLALSIPDFMFQRWKYRESLKMSREEVKEERKMYEGDPHVRSRLRSRMREIMTRNMAVNVPKADVVITNPTHFAVALEYTMGSNLSAPQVTAKGEDEMAFRIRRIAEDNGVPIVENRPLARALYAETEVGDIIPEAYWTVVATVLSKVMHINEERRARNKAAADAASAARANAAEADTAEAAGVGA